MGLRAACKAYSCKRYSAPDVISSGAYHYRVLVSPRADPTPDQGRVVSRRLALGCVLRARVLLTCTTRTLIWAWRAPSMMDFSVIAERLEHRWAARIRAVRHCVGCMIWYPSPHWGNNPG